MNQDYLKAIRQLGEEVAEEIGLGEELPPEPPYEKFKFRQKDGSWGPDPDGHIDPGARVRIVYDTELQNGEKATDEGYLFTLPGMAGREPLRGGVVHLPEPFSGGKGRVGPVWQHLSEIARLDSVEEIRFLDEGVPSSYHRSGPDPAHTKTRQ